ncbi:MAG: response regulator [Myxococcota bacterium]
MTLTQNDDVRPRVLIVDDDPCLRRALARCLGAAADVTSAESVAAAMQAIDRNPDFDLILTDMMMPEGTGQDLFHRLVEDHPTLVAHTYFVTAGVTDPNLKAFVRRHRARVLLKPLRIADVLALLPGAPSRRSGVLPRGMFEAD